MSVIRVMSASQARSRILGHLRCMPTPPEPFRPPPAMPVIIPPAERFSRFQAALEAVRGDVLAVTEENWPQQLTLWMAGQGLSHLLVAPETAPGQRMQRFCDACLPLAPPPLTLIPYDQPVETFKPILLHKAEAALTTCRGAIAETGTLILWPTTAEPRLMSLLPPVHIVWLDRRQIFATLEEALAQQGWADGMPTNALLISGPSKTADIEQTLAFGVHGPRTLLVLAVGDCDGKTDPRPEIPA